ncbi:DUF3868 domain-containing protein [Bacteroides sp. 214]|uniref:DUF3868 domain-containing protein n=1 Tax=Bacteroides sp. 214 TaxID=2302935 RepID=UPI0013CF5084|nr:DUF3868 domain-containing protein [Bacteroides sp. 214]
MKKILFSLFLLFVAWPMTAQEAYKGQLYITRQSLVSSGDDLVLEMDINFEGLSLATDRAVMLIPILRSGNYSFALPGVLINGSEMHRSYRHRLSKADSLAKANDPLPYAVIVDNRKSSRHISYLTSVAYQSWMHDAVLFLRTEELEQKGLVTSIFEDKIADTPLQSKRPHSPVVIDDQLLSLVNIVPPRNEVFTHAGNLLISEYLCGPAHKNKRRERSGYDDVYRLLNTEVNKILNQPGAELAYIHLTGYGYPIGDYQKNGRTAAIRSVELKEVLYDYRLSGKAPLEVTWVSEDWDSIANFVRNSHMQFRESVLNIIESVSVTRGRENMLMTFADGIPYRYLCGEVFPRVPRLSYEIGYIRSVSMPSSPGAQGGATYISLENFYQLAIQSPVGSSNYNDLLDLSARLYPSSAEAAINAAAVALMQRNAPKARGYLEPYAEHPLAYNNMGILYLLEGNSDKAEVYLRMAASAGVDQARRALNALLSRNGNL